MKHSLFFFILLTLCACGNDTPIQLQQNLGPNQPKVLHYGALKNMMHKGDLSAKADLKDFKQAENFFALGAIENLKGEVQIFNSESFNTQVLDGSLSFDHSLNKKAAL